MRLSRTLALVMGLGALALIVGFGTVFTIWQAGKFAAFRTQLEQDAWEIFQQRYPDHEQTFERLLKAPLRALENSLNLTLSLSNQGKELEQRGTESAGWQEVLCRNPQIAFASLQVGSEPVFSLSLTGRAAQKARVAQRRGDRLELIIEGQPALQANVGNGPPTCGAALIEPGGPTPEAAIAILEREPTVSGAWAHQKSPLWPLATRWLASGAQAIAILEGEGAAVLGRSQVVSNLALSKEVPPRTPFLVATGDGRNTFLCLYENLPSGGALAWGVDFRSIMAEFPSRANRAIVLLEQGRVEVLVRPTDVVLDVSGLADLFNDPARRVEAFGRLHLAETEWFFQQFMPVAASDTRVLLLDAPKAPGTPLSVTLQEDEDAQRALLVFAIWAGSLTILALGGLAWFSGRWLAAPIQRVAQQLNRLQLGNKVGPAPHFPPTAVEEVDSLNESCRALHQRMEERAKLQALLDAFVAKPVARQLREGVVHPGGGRFRVSVLFADIRGFTKETVSMRADEVIVLLNSCFEMICPPIEECGGVIDKFIGDEVMAIFGAPDPLSDHANWALKAALGMRKALQEFNQGRAARQLPPVALGWGIASGEVTAGIVGSKDRSNFTALGTVVNRASRLCDAAAPWEILLDPVTAQEASLEGIPFQEEQILLEGLGTETVIRIPPPAL